LQASGHPLKNTSVRMPAPSCSENLWMLKIVPIFFSNASSPHAKPFSPQRLAKNVYKIVFSILFLKFVQFVKFVFRNFSLYLFFGCAFGVLREALKTRAQSL
jgi:hypothetical protein